MIKTPFTFVKIVATPTLSSWSQAYTAGNVTALISLTKNDPETNETSLPALGKDLLNTLEAEYFTLETKTLASIKDAILATCEKNEEGIMLSLSVAVLIENVLYLFIYGNGKILMKRENKVGTLLEKADYTQDVVSGSGYIEHNDIIILETLPFADHITTDVMLPYLSHNKVAELPDVIIPFLHKKQQGDLATIIGSYQEEGKETLSTEEKIADLPQQAELTTDEVVPEPIKQEPQPDEKNKLPHMKKLLLTITAFLFIIFIVSIFFFVKKQEDQKLTAIYQAAVIPAQKKFDEGKSLTDLNKTLAIEDFQSTKTMLDNAKPKLPASSTEYKELSSLLDQVNAALNQANQAIMSSATPVDDKTDTFLAILKTQNNYQAASQDDKNVYVANQDGISMINKSSGKATEIIKNKNDWQNVGGLSIYFGNIYLLDTKDGILKYVSSGGSFGKSGYFPGTAPDLSNSISIAIDGSIWVLGNDGSINKYTKGIQDSFSPKGLEQPLKNPTRIATTIDMNNIYVLDNGNSRVVVFDKSGNYVSQYQATVLANAKEFDIDETNKKIFVLSSGSLYEIDMK